MCAGTDPPLAALPANGPTDDTTITCENDTYVVKFTPSNEYDPDHTLPTRDTRNHVGQLQGNDDNPLFYGHGVARWDGDTFVVDMRRFNEEFWFDNGGLPHTEQLQMTERFTRVDMGTMRYEVTINDPGAYTRPWKSTWTLQWVPGEEMPYFLCQDNRP